MEILDDFKWRYNDSSIDLPRYPVHRELVNLLEWARRVDGSGREEWGKSRTKNLSVEGLSIAVLISR
jgi:hypothetical protein